MTANHSANRTSSPPVWRLISVAVLLLFAGLACNLTSAPAAQETPTLSVPNTVPPTRTLLPTGQVPTVIPLSPFAQPTRFAFQPTAVIIPPTALPLATATSFPTRIPTSTALPAANVSVYSPVNGNVIAGIIQVIGNASHPFFVQYQLEFSPDPGNLWALIPGSISSVQVQNGLLGLWDTRQTPDGVYQLRLRVFSSDGSSTIALVRSLRVSNRTATPPPTITQIPTNTPLPTLTFTQIPTSTPIPTLTPTATQIPSATPIPTVAPPSITPLPSLTPVPPTITPLPTVTSTFPPDIPTNTPVPTDVPVIPTNTPLPTDIVVIPSITPLPTLTFTPAPEYADLNAYPIVPQLPPAMVANLQAVYQNGVLNFGNRPTAFSKVGDDNTAAAEFASNLGVGLYNLDVYAGLQPIIDFYASTVVRDEFGTLKNSFNVTSFAAAAGWSSLDVLDPNRADPASCIAGESPLTCEIRATQPSVMLIMLGSHDAAIYAGSPESFRANLLSIINTTMSSGVIPVLSTVPERLDGAVTPDQVLLMNTEIVNLATAAGVPLWNFWSAARDLPNSGLSANGLTLSAPQPEAAADFSLAGLTYGFNQRNLTALQVLNVLRQTIFPDAQPPATEAPPTVVAEVPTFTPLPPPTATLIPTDLPTWTPVPTEAPLPTAIPTETPLPTALPTDVPTETPLPTAVPTETPIPTDIPTETPLPTAVPTETPLPTAVPTETPLPTEPPPPTEIPTDVPTPAPAPTDTFPPPAVRGFPDTTNSISVFANALPDGLSDAQIQFAAGRYAGTHGVRAAVAQTLRAYNPNFIVLHTRFGEGLGYQTTDGACNFTGAPVQVVEGEWRVEWPDALGDSWFAPYNGQNVYNCDGGWYLMNLDDAAWRTYFLAEVQRQVSINQNDGLMLDDLAVPNIMAWNRFNPQLPQEDGGFEAAWSASITGWIDFLKGSMNGGHIIADAGSYSNGRDNTDYSRASGVLIDEFGLDIWQVFGQGSWELQLNRALSIANRGQVLIAQSYPDIGNLDGRMFSLASYLLVKGNRSFVNLDFGNGLEWVPEYGIPVGAPAQNAASVAELFRGDWGVYARQYANGLVLVNPTGAAATIPLGATYYQALPAGGGFIGADGGVPGDWAVSYAEVTEVVLNPGQAAILLNAAP